MVANSEAPRDGKFLEVVGTYDPLKDPAEVKVNQDKLQGWIDRGAKPTETVKSILAKSSASAAE